ncbi:alpha/beta hydrolase [Acrocarpospora sp. B8E8]|uniref:alpha/beta fold hydrolase n=1 Tax=Acrocarpospora sp. B8E8 TaxID=3153572 RepID=UPI00325FC731
MGTAALASAAHQILGERQDMRRFPPPGKLVDVDGRRLHVWCEGDHGPTVVVVTSLGSGCLEWVRIQRRLLPHHRVVLYDRGGLDWSEWVPGRRSAVELAEELHAALEAADIPGPYVLVGHSLGGSIIRVYAARHPEKAAGLILVDASHERSSEEIVEEFGWRMGDFGRWQRALTRYVLRPRGIERTRVRFLGHRDYHDEAALTVPADWVGAAVALALTTRRRRAVVAELVQNGSANRKAFAAERRDFGDLPLTVITRSMTAVDTYYGFADAEFLRRWMKIWMPLQQDLATLSTNSRHVIAENASHHVHIDEPDLVVSAIIDMCETIRKSRPGEF